MYVQAVGRAGRDGGNVSALLLVRKEKSQHINSDMKLYCENNSMCRRGVLFQNFDEHPYQAKHSISLCMCCDIRALKCDCGKCLDVISGCFNFSYLPMVV